MLLVLAFHAGSLVPGGYVGVDIFFVISGFLITGLLLREQEATGRIALGQFYARRARRLLPAATLVLLVTCAGVACLAAVSDRATFGVDVASAAAYFANWQFAARAVDYLAEDVGRSPVLHFWSLSVEEQFYLVWPTFIVFAVSVGRRFGWTARSTLTAAVQFILLPSLAWSIFATQRDAQEAFFVTSTRLWELGVGATLAIALPRLTELPRPVGHVASWLGAIGILASALVFDPTTSWPGFRALLPTLGTALLVLGGTRAPDGLVARCLGIGPMVWIGGLSYSIYLWHWPVLVAGQDWLHLSGKAWGVGLATLSLVPAWLSHRFLEHPIRMSTWLGERPQLTLSLAGNLSLLAIAAGLGTSWMVGRQPAAATAQLTLRPHAGHVVASPSTLGAGALTTEGRRAGAGSVRRVYQNVLPAASAARSDLPRAYAEGCQMGFTAAQIPWCTAGDADSSRTVVIVGDSKILQYYEALDAAGAALGLRMLSATMSSCAASDATISNKGKPYTRCSEVNAEVMRTFEKNPPLAVISSQSATRAYGGTELTREAMVTGLASRWARLRALGVEVIVVLDNPRPPKETSVYECMLANPENHAKCAFSRKKGISRSAALVQLEAAKRVPGVHVVDLTDLICPESKCAPVIGDVLVYRQGSHITNTYARTLAPKLTEELARILHRSAAPGAP